MNLAFDPVFWLHHCQIDRIYAFWEYIYPDYWMGRKGYLHGGEQTDFIQRDGTYDEDRNQLNDENTPMTPFRKPDNIYWTSNDVRGLASDQKCRPSLIPSSTRVIDSFRRLHVS